MVSEIDYYPTQYNDKVILKDGSVILFRPIKKEDAPVWLDFYHRLSERSKYLRMHRSPPNVTMEDALRYCTVDYINQFAFVAEVIEEHQKRIVAVGRYVRLPNQRTAEVAFIIMDSYQEKGIGTKFIEWLATVARKNNIDTFEAYVLPENESMLSVFQGYGFHMKQILENNIYHITFPLTKTPEVVAKKDERALQATLKSLELILKPHSVAVIGASNRVGSIGQLVFQSMLQSGFKGVIYPINASNEAVMSVQAYHTVSSVPGNVDMAIVAVPSSQILNIVDECGRKKVKGIIIISDGFREKNEQGAVLERDVVETAFGYGMRIVGPNCMGVINTDPAVKLNATFALINPAPGNISFVSQSGALGLGILQYAKSLNIGFSSFASVGNRADIGSIDLLQYWEKDPATKVILLYLESFDNPEIFSRVSRRISLKKPILAIKGGNTPEGSRATRSHTGAMTTSGMVSEALMYEAGIVSVNSVNELFNSAVLLASQPIPKGRRVAVLTNGGGPGILAADACAHAGLKLQELSPETTAKIKTVIKRDIQVHNPVDLTAGVSPEEFEAVLKILAGDKEYDSIITIYVPPAGLDISAVENAISRASNLVRQNDKPLLSCFLGMSGSKGKVMEGNFVPYYLFPEEAASALSTAVRYYELRTKETGTVPEFPDIQREKAQELVHEIMTGSPERPLWISNKDMDQLFKYYGIRFAETAAAETPDLAVKEAERIGFPVVVKLNSSTITHKTDAGGVVMNVNTPDDVRRAFQTIKTALAKTGREKEMQGVTIQPQISDGVEVIVGVAEDSQLGHVLMLGMGGIFAELIKDTALRLTPLTDTKAKDLVNSIKMSELLKGYRGMPPSDIKSLEDLLLRISAMVEDIPHITEMDLNPVKVQADGKGYWVIDSRIMIK